MLQIAICDDQEKERAETHRLISRYLAAYPDLEATVSLFENGSSLLTAMEDRQSFDIYILDIIMPDLDGIALGKAIRKRGSTGQIIYLTSSKDYAVESYDTDALYYMVKPVTQTQVNRIMDKAVGRLSPGSQRSFLVNTANGICRILFDQLLYVEQSKRTMHFYLIDGSIIQSYALREPFSVAVQPLLADPRFLLCGSSFVVNLHRITKIGKEETTFSNGCAIALPRSLQRAVKQEWTEYWLRTHETFGTKNA